VRVYTHLSRYSVAKIAQCRLAGPTGTMIRSQLFGFNVELFNLLRPTAAVADQQACASRPLTRASSRMQEALLIFWA
jgi:hypothetical protein